MRDFTIDQKALRVIERLASADVVEECEMDIVNDRYISQKDAKELCQALTQIYMAAHSAIPEHSCYEVHDCWRKDTESTYQAMFLEAQKALYQKCPLFQKSPSCIKSVVGR